MQNDVKEFSVSNEKSEVGHGDCLQENESVTVMVLGAGRGPLVRATFNAADITKSKVKVIISLFFYIHRNSLDPNTSISAPKFCSVILRIST